LDVGVVKQLTILVCSLADCLFTYISSLTDIYVKRFGTPADMFQNLIFSFLYQLLVKLIGMPSTYATPSGFCTTE